MPRFLPIAIFLVCLLDALSAQGPIDGYMKGKGNFDLALTYSREQYDTYLFGREKQAVSNSAQSVSLFYTLGLNEQMDLVFTLPYIRTDADNKNLQDAVLALKYRNKKLETKNGHWSVITAIGASFPASGYSAATANPIGQRATVFQVRLLSQYLDYGGFFIMAQSGFDFRMIPQQQLGLPLILRMGYGNKYFYIDGWVDHFRTFDQGVDASISAGEGSVWWKLGSTLYVPVTPFLGGVLGYAKILGGENIGLSSRFNIGLVWKYDRGER